jgi:organic hydroperoxide reductase OsmC/OhrA
MALPTHEGVMFRDVATLESSAMADIEVSSTSDGFATTSRVGDFELTVDATNENGPDPNQTLVADYASCYIPAFRVGGQQRDYDDLGRIEIDAEADLDDDDDLEAIRFDMRVEADIAGDEDELVERGEDICHVHSALRDDLGADISVEGNAF